MAYNPKTGKGLGRYYDAKHRAFRARDKGDVPPDRVIRSG